MSEIILYSSLKHEIICHQVHKWFVLSGWERQTGTDGGSFSQKWKSEGVSPPTVGRALRAGDAVDRKVEFLGLLRTLV